MATLVHSTTSVEDKNRWGTTWDCFDDGQVLYGCPFKLNVCAEPATVQVDRFYSSVEWLELRAGCFEQRGLVFAKRTLTHKQRSLALMLWVGLGKMIFGQKQVNVNALQPIFQLTFRISKRNQAPLNAVPEIEKNGQMRSKHKPPMPHPNCM